MAAVDSFHLLFAEISRSCSVYYEALALVGAAYVVSKAVVLLRDCCALVRVHLLPRVMPRKKLSQRFGAWAVVYGAWEPAVEAYAEELARNGISIVFVAPSQASVRDAAESLTQNYGVETVVVLADLSLDRAAEKPVGEALRGRDVGFLVSGVGESRESPPDLLDLLGRDVAGPTLMARLVLPGMAERGRGAVVNIRPGGRAAALTAAAGYVDALSRALQLQYGSRGIVVQTLTPLQISSSRDQRWTESWLAPRPEVYARHAVSTLGVCSRTTGYWPHTLQLGLISCIPDWIWLLGSRVFVSSS
ncbi:inactive hydroxysteroid dehydrogenase-like protein 1 [Salarias fasciatus]|uniref:Inactive hydroxysteroid dehydrogenase-like protein 1 n=1 Tax=Salarias fasciatus TaxID=181472 RepID=A0A672FIT7_SALFA|nr:inactive hydroxysteroid dehydrogenase-like protein 1 [Salarias fasciatus]